MGRVKISPNAPCAWTLRSTSELLSHVFLHASFPPFLPFPAEGGSHFFPPSRAGSPIAPRSGDTRQSVPWDSNHPSPRNTSFLTKQASTIFNQRIPPPPNRQTSRAKSRRETRIPARTAPKQHTPHLTTRCKIPFLSLYKEETIPDDNLT